MLSTFVVLQVIVYAAAQVPAGLLLDRFGSRVLIVCGAALMTTGQLVLALSESLPAAIGARAIVGLGDALTFISVLRLVPYWFEPARVPLVAQLTGICGQLGQVLSAVPFLAILTGSGWTPAYLSVAAFGLVVIVLALALIRNTPHGSALTSEPISLHTTLSRIKTVWLRPGTRLGFFTHMGTQFSVTVFALMWGVPYLTVAQGLSRNRSRFATDYLGGGRHLGRNHDRRIHRPPSASQVTSGALDHRQQRPGVDRGAGPARTGAGLVAGGAHRRHLGGRSRFDGRVRLRPYLQSEAIRSAPPRAW